MPERKHRLIIEGRASNASAIATAWPSRPLAWVPNRLDGNVEAMICGEEAAVEALITWAGSGPPAAHVERVQVAPGEGDLARFAER